MRSVRRQLFVPIAGTQLSLITPVSSPRNTLSHDGIENRSVDLMVGNVIEEVLSEDSWEGRLTGAN